MRVWLVADEVWLARAEGEDEPVSSSSGLVPDPLVTRRWVGCQTEGDTYSV